MYQDRAVPYRKSCALLLDTDAKLKLEGHYSDGISAIGLCDTEPSPMLTP